MTDRGVVRGIRLADLTTELPPQEALDAVAMAMEELAIARALVMVHGKDEAVRIYLERGGHVRFDDEGEPVLLWLGAAGPATPEDDTDG